MTNSNQPNRNMTKCIACHNDIAKGIKACPTCGKDQRSWINRHPILSIFLVILLIGVIGNMVTKGAISSASDTNVVKGAPAEKTVEHTIDAMQIINSYQNNEVRADAIYKDRYIEMSGIVARVGIALGKTFVEINDGKKYTFHSVTCYFKGDEIRRVADLNVGDPITIRGTVSGKMMSVLINNCIIK